MRAASAPSPSIAAEMAWLVDLLVQTARYAEPALDELDGSLLPGIAVLRPTVKGRFESLWSDRLSGCPELLPAVVQNLPVDADARSIFAWLSTLPPGPAPRFALLGEPAADRRLVRRRLERLQSDIRLRRDYRNLLAEVWELAGPTWERRGGAAVRRAAADWSERIAKVKTAAGLARLMPPRHPLAATQMNRRLRFTLVPIYFCMSGGLVSDLGERLLIGVPASAREPIRRTRDAAFVADRARVLCEPTRVHILLYLMSASAGVMEITRALRMTQPVVSEHVRVLLSAGLLRRVRKGSRTVFAAAPGRLERHLEDARATLARWA